MFSCQRLNESKVPKENNAFRITIVSHNTEEGHGRDFSGIVNKKFILLQTIVHRKIKPATFRLDEPLKFTIQKYKGLILQHKVDLV